MALGKTVKQLLEGHGLTVAELVRAFGLPSFEAEQRAAKAIYTLIGRDQDSSKYDELIARHFGLSLEELRALARGRPYVVTTPRKAASSSDKALGASRLLRRRVPLISWERAARLDDSNPADGADAEDWVLADPALTTRR